MMPRPQHPPTPASSTEIKSKDGSQFPSLQMSFELPPPAVTDTGTVAGAGAGTRPASSSRSSKSSSASSYHPDSTSPTSPAIPASEVVKTRRRSSVAQRQNQDAFALPPPPTRSRKIIQMKPKGPAEEIPEGPEPTTKELAKTAPAPKKKPPSSTSAAGRKIARKTAHSLIERRRRSKMNEEFGVLKDMIPACTGEMHKLAILQASIDYVRYLEDCVTKLKAENDRTHSTPVKEQYSLPPPPRPSSLAASRPYGSHEEDGDVEMGGSDGRSPTYSTPMPPSHRPSASPALQPQDSRNRQDSYSSASTDQRHYSFSASSTTSPALGPSTYESSRGIGSALTSPTLLPQRDLDQEATTALLMLNTDRRGTHGTGRGGMSVQDLLSA
ncbi:hypothetical protein BJ875DRAFT_214094 [Amylocarpus encephaloides]|uniref:BHLH domain-containing protein n=1 Tax=Amylocarpus encephaloides TaxID=45428 RepID=A0A9P7Y8H2_9HELO|nr:hypothetical protein BJ875DRAFT_214094 [Amylocarpus encephaloides]